MVGNNECNDETNNEACEYDGGDCCGSCVNKDHCSHCACLVEEFSIAFLHARTCYDLSGTIRSPAFPMNYPNGNRWIWMIRLTVGKFIEISFLSLDVEALSSGDW